MKILYNMAETGLMDHKIADDIDTVFSNT